MLFQRKKGGQIIIIGLNQISICLAKALSKKNDVIILYNKSAIDPGNLHMDVIFEEVEEEIINSLKELEIGQIDCLVALTKDDEFNLFIAGIAKDIGIKRTAGMTRGNQFIDLQLSVDLIFNQYQIILDQISNKINATRMHNIKNFITGKVSLSDVVVSDNDPFSYLQIKNMKLEGGLIIAIQRGNKVLLPGADMRLCPGDKAYFIFKRGMFNNIFEIFKSYKSKKRLFILGGTNLGLSIIRCWNQIFEPIIVIEKDLQLCNRLAAKLEKVLILHGEGIDLQLLKEEGIDKSSVFLAASPDDYDNLLSSFGALKAGCRNVITLLNNPPNKQMGELLQLDNLLIIPEIISEYIVEFISSGQGINKFVLGDQIYSSEIIVRDNSSVINRQIVDLNLPSGIIIGVVKRNNDIIIADGSTTIIQQDILVVFFYQKYESLVYSIFK